MWQNLVPVHANIIVRIPFMHARALQDITAKSLLAIVVYIRSYRSRSVQDWTSRYNKELSCQTWTADPYILTCCTYCCEEEAQNNLCCCIHLSLWRTRVSVLTGYEAIVSSTDTRLRHNGVKKRPGNLSKFKLLTSAARLELAVPIRFRNASRDSCGISWRHKYITV